MRGAADGCNRLPEEVDLDRPESQPLLERKIPEEPARPLGQVGRVGPAHVLTARAGACFLMPPRAGSELSRMSAAETLDQERIHSPIVGPKAPLAVPHPRESLRALFEAPNVLTTAKTISLLA
jgi:hypothetical protein